MPACPTVAIESSHPSQGAFVEINESDFDPTKHVRYIAPPTALPPLPPPPPPPSLPDPLDQLGRDWKGKSPAELRALAQTITGRTAENKLQAVQMIETALAAGK